MLVFLVNLALTILIEVIANKVLFKEVSYKPVTKRVVIANVISNPIAQLAHRALFFNLWIVEFFVVIFEALFYLSKGTRFSKAVTISLLLNITSILVGILIYSL